MEELSKLKRFIDSAINKCQEMICQNPNIVLSEGDLEKLLCDCISKEIGYNPIKPEDSFSVHTQISHYMDSKVHSDMRVDILLLQESNLKNCTKAKKFQYCNNSFALELKYLHERDNIEKVMCDFCKRKYLDVNSWLYVVVLLDYTDNKLDLFEDRKKKIEGYAKEMYDKKDEYKENLFFKIISVPLKWDEFKY